MKTGRRLFVTLFVIVGGLLISGPMLFLIYGVLGAALSGLLVLLAGALLPLPIMLAMKKMGWLPETVFRRPDRAPASSGNSSPFEHKPEFAPLGPAYIYRTIVDRARFWDPSLISHD